MRHWKEAWCISPVAAVVLSASYHTQSTRPSRACTHTQTRPSPRLTGGQLVDGHAQAEEGVAEGHEHADEGGPGRRVQVGQLKGEGQRGACLQVRSQLATGSKLIKGVLAGGGRQWAARQRRGQRAMWQGQRRTWLRNSCTPPKAMLNTQYLHSLQ
jgi:hypothetical protein